MTKAESNKKYYKEHREDRLGYWYEYYHLKLKLDPLNVYKRRKCAWEYKYGGTYPYGPEHEKYLRRN